MEFVALAAVPGLLALLAIAVVAISKGPYRAAGLATLGCLLVMAVPWLLIWYTREVQGDPTANIGAAFLVMAQPVLVPIGTLIGWSIGFNLSGQGR